MPLVRIGKLLVEMPEPVRIRRGIGGNSRKDSGGASSQNYYYPPWMAKNIGDTVSPSGFIYLRPAAAGLADGSDWANATTLDSLDTLLDQARSENKHILVRADEGAHTPPINTNINGFGNSQDNPVIIRGVNVDLTDALATIQGDRAPIFAPGAAQGSAWLRVNGGSAYITFSSLKFLSWGNGAIQLRGDGVSDIALLDCAGENLYRCIENTASGGTASANRITVRRFTGDIPGGFERGFSRFQYDSSDLYFENVHINGNQQVDDPFQAGFVITSTVHNVFYRRCIAINFQVPGTTDPGLYWNGDGFSGERTNYNILLEDCDAESNTDAGYDFKSSNIYFRRCKSRDNKNDFRGWGDAILESCESRDPLKRGGTGDQSHLNVPQGTTPEIRAYGFLAHDVSGSSVVYHVQGGSSLVADAANDIITAGSQEHLEDGATVTYLDRSLDVTPPVITSSATATVDEMSDFVMTPTANEAILYWEIVGGADRDLFTLNGWHLARDGAHDLMLSAMDFESPSDANGDNVYEVQIQAVDLSLRRSAVQTVSVTVHDVAGDEGGDAVHVRAKAYGLANGTNWANAYALTNIDAAVQSAAGNGKPVWIRSDEPHVHGKAWGSTISITHGGSDDAHHVVIEGRDAFGNLYAPNWDTGDKQLLNPMFIGSRTVWTLPPDPETITNVNGWSAGNALFSLGSGANYLTFRYLGFSRLSQPISMQGGALTPNHHLLYQDLDLFNCMEGIFMDASHGSPYNITSRRLKHIGYSKRVHRIRADAHDWLIEDFHFNCGRQDGDNFPSGILFDETAHDVVINGTVPGGKYDGVICNNQESQSASYWQGDGIQSERTNYNISINRVTVFGNADGGLDLKSTQTTVTDCIMYDNKRNYRLWGTADVRAITCASYNPHKRGGSGAADVFYIGGGGRVALQNCTNVHDGGIEVEDDAILWVDAVSDAAFVNVDYTLLGSGQHRTWDPSNTTTPVVTSTATPSVNEGTDFSLTITANTTIDLITITGGADQAFFTIVGSALQMTSKDFENPTDADLNGVYEVTVTVLSTGLKSVTQAISVTVANVVTEPWELISVNSVTGVASGNLTIADAGAPNDLLVVCVFYRDTPTFGTPSGWTKVDEKSGSSDVSTTYNNNSSANAVMFACVRGGSAPVLTFPRTGGSTADGAVLVYRNCDPSPLDVWSSNALTSGSTTTTCPSITTSQNNDLIVSMIADGNNTGSVPKWHDWVAATDPNTASPNPGAIDATDPSSAWKLRFNSNSNNSPGIMMGVADAVKATAGATGQISAINTQSGKNSIITAAFKRAVP